MRLLDKMILVVISYMSVYGAYAGGFIIKEENDLFACRHKDQYYTQGLLLSYRDDVFTYDSGNKQWYVYGLRNQFYTPKDIKIADPQPWDRPWSGLTAFSLEDWFVHRSGSIMTEYLVGVAGSWSLSDQIQTTVHRWIGSPKPMGWSNQIPDEIVVNVTKRWYRPKELWGSRNGWGCDLTEISGGSLGNAFVNVEIAGLVRAGYRIPSDYRTEIIVPTLTQNRFYTYLTLEIGGRAVVQNMMLGGSLFTDGPSQILKPFVSDISYGLAAGIDRPFGLPTDIGFSWVTVHRSFEFIGQDAPANFGSLTLSFLGSF